MVVGNKYFVYITSLQIVKYKKLWYLGYLSKEEYFCFLKESLTNLLQRTLY